MRVLILGSGAREHALAWKYSKSKRITGLFIAPGNARTKDLGTNLPEIKLDNSNSIIKNCREYNISHVFVSSIELLSEGLVDKLALAGIKAVGPHKKAARLEYNKDFSKHFMKKYKIPTADTVILNNKRKLKEYIKNNDGKYLVLKKNGIAKKKRIIVSKDVDKLLSFGQKTLKKDSLIVEEFIEGCKISAVTLYDGKNYKLLPLCSDLKIAEKDNNAPISGGMGAICPVPFSTKSIISEIEKEIIIPTFEGINKENLNYRGILSFDIILTKNRPKLLEYKVRLGDPEAQVLSALIESDFCNISDAILNQILNEYNPRFSGNIALAVTVASKDYPQKYKKDAVVNSLPIMSEKDVLIFHSSTKIDKNRNILTGGGRCFTCVGIGPNVVKANAKAYSAAENINFEGAWFRKDIGKKFFSNDFSN